jgi:hypothetical protein
MDLDEMGVDWIRVAQNLYIWRAFVIAVMDFRFPLKARSFLTT